jgi:hypothetical protein
MIFLYFLLLFSNFKEAYKATESPIEKDMLSRHLEVLGICYVHIKGKRTLLQQHHRVLMTISDFKLVLTHSPNHLLTHSPNHLPTHSLTHLGQTYWEGFLLNCLPCKT